MAQIKLLKFSASNDETYAEMDSTNDDITLNSFSVQGSGPVLSGTGLDLAAQNISNSGNIDFDDPSANTIEQTAGAVIIDDLLAKDRGNSMASGSDILFGSVGDIASELDAFQVPQASSEPTQTPSANTNAGYLVTFNGSLWIWDGSAWNDLGTADNAQGLVNSFTANGALLDRDLVYISAADSVSKADTAAGGDAAKAIGFARSAAADTASVEIQTDGVLDGFSGLTVGDSYYADPSNPGLITNVKPSGAGQSLVLAGIAVSTTSLFIKVEYLGRRAS